MTDNTNSPSLEGAAIRRGNFYQWTNMKFGISDVKSCKDDQADPDKISFSIESAQPLEDTGAISKTFSRALTGRKVTRSGNSGEILDATGDTITVKVDTVNGTRPYKELYFESALAESIKSTMGQEGVHAHEGKIEGVGDWFATEPGTEVLFHPSGGRLEDILCAGRPAHKVGPLFLEATNTASSGGDA